MLSRQVAQTHCGSVVDLASLPGIQINHFQGAPQELHVAQGWTGTITQSRQIFTFTPLTTGLILFVFCWNIFPFILTYLLILVKKTSKIINSPVFSVSTISRLPLRHEEIFIEFLCTCLFVLHLTFSQSSENLLYSITWWGFQKKM